MPLTAPPSHFDSSRPCIEELMDLIAVGHEPQLSIVDVRSSIVDVRSSIVIVDSRCRCAFVECDFNCECGLTSAYCKHVSLSCLLISFFKSNIQITITFIVSNTNTYLSQNQQLKLANKNQM